MERRVARRGGCRWTAEAEEATARLIRTARHLCQLLRQPEMERRPGVAPERRGRDIEVPGPLPVAKDARVLLQRYTVTRLGCALAAGKALAKQKACQKLLQRTHCCGQKHILLARKDALL